MVVMLGCCCGLAFLTINQHCPPERESLYNFSGPFIPDEPLFCRRHTHHTVGARIILKEISLPARKKADYKYYSCDSSEGNLESQVESCSSAWSDDDTDDLGTSLRLLYTQLSKRNHHSLGTLTTTKGFDVRLFELRMYDLLGMTLD